MAAKEDIRKSLARLIQEREEHRHKLYKIFEHKKSGDRYQLILFAFDEHTNVMQCVYGLVALPWLKFVCPADEFWQKFAQEVDTPYPGPALDRTKGPILSPSEAPNGGEAV